MKRFRILKVTGVCYLLFLIIYLVLYRCLFPTTKWWLGETLPLLGFFSITCLINIFWTLYRMDPKVVLPMWVILPMLTLCVDLVLVRRNEHKLLDLLFWFSAIVVSLVILMLGSLVGKKKVYFDEYLTYRDEKLRKLLGKLGIRETIPTSSISRQRIFSIAVIILLIVIAWVVNSILLHLF